MQRTAKIAHLDLVDFANRLAGERKELTGTMFGPTYLADLWLEAGLADQNELQG